MIEETLVSLIKFSVNFSGVPVFPIQAPEEQPFPFITYQRVDSVPVYSIYGPSGLAATRFQFNCWSRQYAQVKSISTNLRQLFQGYKNFPAVQGIFIQNEQDTYIAPNMSDEVGYYGAIVDFVVWHGN
jgi:hypothetical protein